MNEFSKKSKERNNVPRSTHDLSFQNNLTLKFGAITPVFCREVLGGDSFRIKPTFGLRALPLVFPCQTRMRAYLHFFYVRNRTLWKDWVDFIFGTKSNLVSPYLSLSTPVQYRASSLADYLGLPVVRYNTTTQGSNPSHISRFYVLYDSPLSGSETVVALQSGYYSFSETIVSSMYYTILLTADIGSGNTLLSNGDYLPLASRDIYTFNTYYRCSLLNYVPGASLTINTTTGTYLYCLDSNYRVLKNIQLSKGSQTIPAGTFPKGTVYISIASSLSFLGSSITLNPNPVSTSTDVNLYFTLPELESVSVDDLSTPFNPYRSSSAKLNPSALPFRAYEAIYNAYYRNQLVEPLLVNGQPEYNKFITNYDTGGSDNFFYQLHYRNWEDDVFTTCMPSPQQGSAPMVGVTIKGNNQTSLAFSDADGNVYNAVPVLNSSKDGISSFTITSASDSAVIPVSAALNSGITINDFRNVNALQRYLELSQLRGYRYKDLMSAHLNVDIRYNELMMPEFIGGCSRDINVSQITATANTLVDGIETQVGDYKAQAGLVGQCGNITKYCDEHGFIIGLLTIVPVPVYGQQLQKFWFKRSQFDYFSPEFANIGYQSVSKKEIAPLNLPADQLDKTFGYQRPWYEYLSSLDQSHGLFNTSLRNFILNRSFGSDVNLTADFLHVDPKQLNNIFSSTLENDDKFLGEIYFDVKVKTAVPSSVLPKLE